MNQRNFVWHFYFADRAVTEIDLANAIWNINFKIRCRNTRATFFKAVIRYVLFYSPYFDVFYRSWKKRNFLKGISIIYNQNRTLSTTSIWRLLAHICPFSLLLWSDIAGRVNNLLMFRWSASYFVEETKLSISFSHL